MLVRHRRCVWILGCHHRLDLAGRAMRRIRTGNRRRAKAHARAEAERIRKWRLKKLMRAVIRESMKAMVKHLEDLILYGDGLANGGIVNNFGRGGQPCFFGIDLAQPGADRSVEFVVPHWPRLSPVEVAARRLGATPAGFGLWNLPGYPELTTGQLLQIAGE